MDSLQATAVVYSAVRVGSRGGCAGLTCKLKMYCFFFSPLRQREQTDLLNF